MEHTYRAEVWRWMHYARSLWLSAFNEKSVWNSRIGLNYWNFYFHDIVAAATAAAAFFSFVQELRHLSILMSFKWAFNNWTEKKILCDEDDDEPTTPTKESKNIGLNFNNIFNGCILRLMCGRTLLFTFIVFICFMYNFTLSLSFSLFSSNKNRKEKPFDILVAVSVRLRC